MTFEEYAASERPKYERLAGTIKSILKAAIVHAPQLRLQHTQYRAKDVDSLERKLRRDGYMAASNIEEHAKDLAGCRLVFYTNADVSAFLSSRIIVDNFEVDWDRTKIHHPDSGSGSAAEQFVSNNYVVSLKDDRAALPEYSDVAGLWCEVQVQTTLNHAWAETAHDTIYKRPELPGGFGASLMESIETRMRDIMREHLLPAGYEFQKVLDDFERLSTGKQLFDRGLLKALDHCEDNNSRYELIERFSEYVLPHYDDIEGVFDEIFSALRAAVTAARESPNKPIDTPFGSYPGHSSADVVKKVGDIVDRLKYVKVITTFEFLVEMFSDASDPDERSRWIASADELAKFDISAWKQVGPGVQLSLLARTKRLPKRIKEATRPLIVSMLGKMLETEITGTEAQFDRIVLSRGTIPFNAAVRKVRAQAVRMLKLFALTASDDIDRRDAISELHRGTRFAGSRGAADEIVVEVLENSRDIVEFYRSFAGKMSFELLESTEHKVLWLYRHTADPLTAGAESSEVDRSRLKLRAAIREFSEAINSDDRFVIYKTLVGYESVFRPSWDDPEFDIGAVDDYRSQRIDEFVASASAENADFWLDIIKTCASTQSGDLATFPKFGEFLEKLAKSKPEIAFRALLEEENLLARFLPSITKGLENSPRYDELRALKRKWITEGKFLSAIIWTFRSAQSVDIELLNEAMRQAIVRRDAGALFNLVTVADLRSSDIEGGLVETLLLPAVKALDDLGEHRWPNAIWGGRENTAIYALTEAQSEELLEALLHIPRIDWREEEILKAIARVRPKLVVDFFGNRLDIKHERKKDYSAVPFQFYHLQEQLLKEPAYVVDMATAWFRDDPSLFMYRGGKVVSNVFANAWPQLEQELRRYLDGSNQNLNFIIQILRTFEGEVFLHPFIKDVIDMLEPDSELLGELGIALNESGVVTGEFGFVDLYKERREQIKVWLEDARPRVKKFAEAHIRLFDRMIAAEQRRAEEDHELRKRNWGPIDDDPSKSGD